MWWARHRIVVLLMLASLLFAGNSGCSLIFPDVTHEPVIHNPFPQLSRVAVAPFFNQSDDRTVDGRRFALAYYAELQAVPGYEVVPLGVVEQAILENRVDLSQPSEARRLATILGVDAVAIGAITDYSPYYPPRCGLRVEWYAANPGFHEIPPGYGLPWGTPEEEFIPQPLVFESEFALAKAQLATQTPACGTLPVDPPTPQDSQPSPSSGGPFGPYGEFGASSASDSGGTENSDGTDAGKLGPHASGRNSSSPGLQNDRSGLKPSAKAKRGGDVHGAIVQAANQETAQEEELPPNASTTMVPAPPVQSESAATGDTIGAAGVPVVLPPGWPDERGFIPPPPSPVRPACCPTNRPVMTHTKIYHGNDGEFTEALASYYHFRDDARFGGWQNYLMRSDDFIRFCCHMHIAEMLSARGGASETRVVWSWSDCR
jgi:hypothetical protein